MKPGMKFIVLHMSGKGKYSIVVITAAARPLSERRQVPDRGNGVSRSCPGIPTNPLVAVPHIVHRPNYQDGEWISHRQTTQDPCPFNPMPEILEFVMELSRMHVWTCG